MPRVVISGLGLIGGSIALALRSRGWDVAYIDPAVAIDEAVAAGAATERMDDFGRVSAEDIVVLATPVDVAMRTLQDLDGTNASVTSVCSVMAPLRDASPAIRFAAGHPFAGAETTGLGSARADLFTGRTWFLDSGADASPFVRLIEACGATVTPIDARLHDELVALTSHLPQLISTALASVIVERNVPPELIGSGVRTLLRLAGSPQSVWQPVIETNGANIDSARELFEEALRRIARGDGTAEFGRANELSKKA